MIVYSEQTSYVDEQGREEEYTWKELSRYLSGHLRRRSSMEGTDCCCGNCDGTRCDTCKEIFEVFKWSEPKPHIDPDYGWRDYDYQDRLEWARFNSLEAAKAFYDELKL